MTPSRLSRIFMLAVALVAISAAAAIDAPSLRAECCAFAVSNNSTCTFRVTWTMNGLDSIVVATPGGSNSWTIPFCRPFRLHITDSCGVDHNFPTTPGTCIVVYLGAGCCVEICQITECRWEAHNVHCPPCV